MSKRNKSVRWAVNQLKNRSLQGISYHYNKGWAKPSRIIFCLTLRCNIKCRHCAIWRLPKPEELTTDEWKKVISDVRKWMGPYRVQLAGGETFARKDVLEIVRHATKEGVLTGVVSNGILITEELAREIVDSGLGYIHISLDGIKAETHDFIRGVPGIYSRALEGIENLRKASKGSGMSVCIATVIMKQNMHELVDLVRWVEEKDLDGIIFNPLGPTIDSDPDWYNKTDLWFDDLEKINQVLDDLIDLKRKGARILNPPEHFEDVRKYFANPAPVLRNDCMIGLTNLSITCDGDIHTCYVMPPIGNVRDMTPGEAWNSPEAAALREKIKRCDIHCSPGNLMYRRSLLSEIKRYLRFG